jgi:hypothetical protein
VLNARVVKIPADDLAGVVDAVCNNAVSIDIGAACTWWNEGSVNAIAVQEGLRVAVTVVVIPNDFTRIVDGEGSNTWPAGRRRIVGKGGVGSGPTRATCRGEKLPAPRCLAIPAIWC